ncbi:MAG: T9SS type A sorting domain-containing protein, partial [Phaeodactylibacter sp.]|nr:T9SS type A sorting domain-containing protein [Phaeodactylibacter sp.]
AVSRFCGGSSNSTVIASLNSVISYVQSRSGNGIPSNEASFIISQVQILISAINAGGVQCCQANARPSLPGNAGFAAQAEKAGLDVFPNPFSRQATIRFYLPQAEQARLEVFNLQGQRVKVLLSETMEEGYYEHSWDGTADGGQQLEAGIYLIRLRTASGAITLRLSLAR